MGFLDGRRIRNPIAIIALVITLFAVVFAPGVAAEDDPAQKTAAAVLVSVALCILLCCTPCVYFIANCELTLSTAIFIFICGPVCTPVLGGTLAVVLIFYPDFVYALPMIAVCVLATFCSAYVLGDIIICANPTRSFTAVVGVIISFLAVITCFFLIREVETEVALGVAVVCMMFASIFCVCGIYTLIDGICCPIRYFACGGPIAFYWCFCLCSSFIFFCAMGMNIAFNLYEVTDAPDNYRNAATAFATIQGFVGFMFFLLTFVGCAISFFGALIYWFFVWGVFSSPGVIFGGLLPTGTLGAFYKWGEEIQQAYEDNKPSRFPSITVFGDNISGGASPYEPSYHMEYGNI